MRSEEVTGLVVAAGAHVAIVVALAIHVLRDPVVIPPPDRVVVSLAEDVGLTSTAPEISQQSQAAVAPTLGEMPLPEPAPKPEPKPQPKPQPKVAQKPEQKPKTPVVNPRTSSQTKTPPPTKAPTKPATPTKPAGGSRLGDDFLKGMSDGERTGSDRVPASQIGSSVKASLFSQIAREIRPHWKPPSGAEADQLVTVIRFRLNPDGTLAGKPTVVGQRGQTDANRTQAGRHQELAIRAVQLAAPFDLDPKYYEAWKSVGPLDFDWKLSQ